MKWPAALFQKKEYEIVSIFKSQKSSKNLKENVKKIIGVSFKNNTSVRLCVFIVCCLSFIYELLEAVAEKCFLSSSLFKLSNILEKYLWKYLLLLKL